MTTAERSSAAIKQQKKDCFTGTLVRRSANKRQKREVRRGFAVIQLKNAITTYQNQEKEEPDMRLPSLYKIPSLHKTEEGDPKVGVTSDRARPEFLSYPPLTMARFL